MENNIDNLYKLLKLNFPVVKDSELGFLEIIKKGHNENIISAIYAHYLDKKTETGYSSMFLETILEIAHLKLNKKIEISNYEVFTELKTKSGKRIDIALADLFNKTAIIIENKIYHQLNNDLNDYWNHFTFPEENKIGIVLSLNHLKIEKEFEGKFINITHNELINKILSKKIQISKWNKHQVYITDFFQTLKNLTRTINMDELAKFYFRYSQVLRSAENAIKHGENYLFEQQKLLASKLEMKPDLTNYLEYVNYWDEKNKRETTFYTVIYENLVEGKFEITIIIELQGKDMELIPIIEKKLFEDEHFKSFSGSSSYFEDYVHFIKRDYPITELELANLADFTYNKIEADFAPLMEKILAIIDDEK